jgi:hypothetical protein
MPRSAATSCLGGQRIASRRTVDRQPRVAEEHRRSDRRVRSLGAGDVLTRHRAYAYGTPRHGSPHRTRLRRPSPPFRPPGPTPPSGGRCGRTLRSNRKRRDDAPRRLRAGRIYRLIACRAGVALTHQTYRRCLDCRGTQFPQRSPGTPCPWGEQGYRGSSFPKLAVRSDVGPCITRSAAAPSLRRAATFPEHVPGRHRLAGQFASPNDRGGIDLAQRVLEPLRRDPTDRLEETLDDAAYLWIG